MLAFLSLYVILSILLSIMVCAAASLFCASLVSVQVSTPYVIAGSTQESHRIIIYTITRITDSRALSMMLYGHFFLTVPRLFCLPICLATTSRRCSCVWRCGHKTRASFDLLLTGLAIGNLPIESLMVRHTHLCVFCSVYGVFQIHRRHFISNPNSPYVVSDIKIQLSKP